MDTPMEPAVSIGGYHSAFNMRDLFKAFGVELSDNRIFWFLKAQAQSVKDDSWKNWPEIRDPSLQEKNPPG